MSAGSSGGCAVEGVDLGADRFVFVGDDAVGDAGVGEGHLHGAVSEQRGDGFEAHAAVDGLGGERVAELVGVHGTPAARPTRATMRPMRPVERAVVVGDQSLVAADVFEVGRGPVGEQLDEVGVQRDVAVVAELADRDPQPVAVADQHDRVGGEVAEFAGAQAGAGEQLDDEPVAGIAAARAAAMSRAASRSLRNFGSGSGRGGMSPAMIGLRSGASGQSHSMSRSKNRRTSAAVAGACSADSWPRLPGWAASHTL